MTAVIKNGSIVKVMGPRMFTFISLCYEFKIRQIIYNIIIITLNFELSQENQTFRIVGRKMDSNDVTVNCGVVPQLIYNEATPRFHQWRSSGQVFGLNFASTEEAADFAQWMKTAIEMVNGRIPWPSQQE